ncbi:AAA family ATPase [Oceanospirillum sediminis]|uniref:MoxR family ATPase n=1 Tax=Oceanospirillum sediminis TaxID=2760088 RepID=A0A839ILF6_9GAMM|nr:MoxR family ATPase [Oceanospirillum sediminis]MBB1485329.1 MoxR family ATPase [Oceanospirillum sediminis]
MSLRDTFQQLKQQLQNQIIGQETLLNRLLIALLADGHLLVEGPPGLAKTKAIKVLADQMEGDFQRIQFTPDLLPADITGTDIYQQESGQFSFQQGPVFNHFILSDEINRAPAKVQAALLEAMAERQVTVGNTSYSLPDTFLVMATQNPIEQEGTYPLPEAQLDRFLMHIQLTYPSAEAELQILRLIREEQKHQLSQAEQPEPLPVISQQQIREARQSVLDIYMAEPIEHYIVHLVDATRRPEKYDQDLASWIEYGVSPRATLALDRCARAHAWLSERDFVTPEDVQAVLPDVFRHRLLLKYEAEAAGLNSDQVIAHLVQKVPVS